MKEPLLVLVFATSSILAQSISKDQNLSECSESEWRCEDGSCIDLSKKCDEIDDCPDRSDETRRACKTKHKCVLPPYPTHGSYFSNDHPDAKPGDIYDRLVLNFTCQEGYRIMGAASVYCIYGVLARNFPRCVLTFQTVFPATCGNLEWQCHDGNCIELVKKCDGRADCADRSDEDSSVCMNYKHKCELPPYPTHGSFYSTNYPGAKPGVIYNSLVLNFTCQEGFRIRGAATVLCIYGLWTHEFPTCYQKDSVVLPAQKANCVVPPYPDHGGFITNSPGAKPGDKYDFITLNFTCQEGYGIQGVANMYCLDGFWQHAFPKCVRLCQLNTNSPGVEYWCEIPNTNGGTRSCRPFEPSGTIVYPNCKTPNYYSPNELPIMSCINGHWDYAANCIPECGTVTSEAEELVINGMSAKHGELPWHVGIYSKNYEPYMQICGGSIVSSALVISAAHCFWDGASEATFPASQYAVGAGKIYRPWNDPNDAGAQKTNVSDLKIPGTFLGAERNFADDIALVFVSQPFIFKTFIRPVCLSSNEQFEKTQLFDGNLGKVAGWGLTASNGDASELLKVVDLPFVNTETCISKAPAGYREHITSEKFCAGYHNGKALCKGDSGGGLVFPSEDHGVIRYYLRGVVSTAPKSFDLCNAGAITSFTQISKQYSFIRRYHSPILKLKNIF